MKSEKSLQHDPRKAIESLASAAEGAHVAKEFPVYSARQRIARFLALHDLFLLQLPVKGSIVEGGVFRGGSLFSLAHFSWIYEPVNYHRKIIGFDTFEGFPSTTEMDSLGVNRLGVFDAGQGTFERLKEASELQQANSLLPHKEKIELVLGDATQSMPEYLRRNPHMLVSMLMLDFDIYEPTKAALQCFLPRMPKGSVLVFDEVHNPNWAGETAALLEEFELGKLNLRGFPTDPHLSFAVLD